jgi:hypothetical protein|tara:strand:+ start:226 stop:654 length:429 start_codon:yes stop_codon:yes gene_type:complete
MKTLDKNIQKLIKKQRLTLKNMENSRWGNGNYDLTYRITLVSEDVYWRGTRVNIYVKGMIEDRKAGEATHHSTMRPAVDVVKKTTGLGWGDAWKQRSVVWGEQYNKNIRKTIRREVTKEIHDFLKLIGNEQNIQVDKVNFEK